MMCCLTQRSPAGGCPEIRHPWGKTASAQHKKNAAAKLKPYFSAQGQPVPVIFFDRSSRGHGQKNTEIVELWHSGREESPQLRDSQGRRAGKTRNNDSFRFTMKVGSKTNQIYPNGDELLDNLPGVVYRCLNDDQWKMLFISEQIFELSGFPAADFINGKIAFADIVIQKDWDIIREKVRNAIGQNKKYELTYRITSADNEIKWVWERGGKVQSMPDGTEILEGFIVDISERKIFESKLKQSEEKFRSLYENIPIGLYRATFAGRFLSVNPAMVKMFGFASESELLNKPVRDVYVTPAQRDLFLQKLEEQGILTSSELFVKRKDGSPFWISLSALVVYDEKGRKKFYDGHMQDISEQKKVEKIIKESEERYRVLTENVADGVVLVRDGKILFANKSFRGIFAVQENAALEGMRASLFVPANHREEFEKNLAAVQEGSAGQPVFQRLCNTKDGREIWVEAHANVIQWNGNAAVLAIVRDITEKKRKELALEEEAETLRRENLRLKETSRCRYQLNSIVGKSRPMQEVYELILQAAATNANVIIYGESGTGKELTARAIHDLGDRQARKFISVNCGAIPENLIESEFFGHKRGAFTGANLDKSGYLDAAHGGTLFLDEIGDIPLTLQVKLLRAIEGGGYSPVGGTEIKKPDVRIIAATNKNLKEQVRKGLMREDFFYRIDIVPIHLPPLRERREDIPILIDHFLERFDVHGKAPKLSGDMKEALINYDWPGNVRELANVLQRFVTLNKIDLKGLSLRPIAPEREMAELEIAPDQNYYEIMSAFEKKVLSRTLQENQWHRGNASEKLGINRKTLFQKLKKHGII